MLIVLKSFKNRKEKEEILGMCGDWNLNING